ncbi:hypothetical protein [Mucilaginibacter sp. HD30]
MEEKLWQYIDGTCSDDERLAIAALIENDAAWHTAFTKMLELDNSIAEISLDEPSMAFSYNVMEAIRAQEASKPLKTTINTYVVGAIAGFFIAAIIGVLALIFSQGRLSIANSPVDVSLPDLSVPVISSVLRVFFYADVILLLFLVDTFLRRRKSTAEAKSV